MDLPSSSWPNWPRPRRGKIPASFLRYEERLKFLLGGPRRRKVYKIAPSPVQLAEQGHNTSEFEKLVADLFADPFMDYPDRYKPAAVLAGLLFRSGYYHALTLSEPTRPIRQRVVDRIQYGERECSLLWMLGGCKFPRSFEILDFRVERFTSRSLANLGAAVKEYEQSDYDRLRYCRYERREDGSYFPIYDDELWCLVSRETVNNGWRGKAEWKVLADAEFKRRQEEGSALDEEVRLILERLERAEAPSKAASRRDDESSKR